MSGITHEKLDNINYNLDNNNQNIHKKKGIHYSRFLLQLYQILEDDNYKDIIHWGENGKYFVIENVHDFTEKILPKYYNHNNYSSFVRQLNMYDFHKKKTNSDKHTFQHSKFIKGQKELIKTILRKKKKEKNITSLVPLNTELVKYNDIYNLNNINNKIETKQNTSTYKHSLSIDEEKDNNQFNIDNIEHSLIEYNKKNMYPQIINDQISSFQLKENLMNDNNNNINNKKITKKSINDLLNCLIKNVEDNSQKQKKLNSKIDSLSNKNLEYINKNNSLLDEIKSKIDYNKKFETVVCFILEIQKIKNEGALKNILISNDLNNNHIKDNNNDMNKLEIINLEEPKQEINGIVPANEFLQKKTYNNNIIDPIQSFLNKYMEKNKNRGLLTNSETINNINLNNINNIINNKNEIINNDINNKNSNLLLTNGDEIKKDNDVNNINNKINKDNNSEEQKSRRPSIDFNSSIFHRNRSSSFNSILSNNTNNFNDNFNNNDFIFKKDGINAENNCKNDNSIFFNNSQSNNNNNKSEIMLNNNDINNFDNNLNKSFEGEFNQDKNFERKDSLNNSSISYIDLYNKSDIFGGDNNNSFNFY